MGETVIEGMERAKAIVLRRTQIPEGAHEPTRDATVVLGEHIAELIDQEIVRELQAQGKAAVPEMTAEQAQEVSRREANGSEVVF